MSLVTDIATRLTESDDLVMDSAGEIQINAPAATTTTSGVTIATPAHADAADAMSLITLGGQPNEDAPETGTPNFFSQRSPLLDAWDGRSGSVPSYTDAKVGPLNEPYTAQDALVAGVKYHELTDEQAAALYGEIARGYDYQDETGVGQAMVKLNGVQTQYEEHIIDPTRVDNPYEKDYRLTGGEDAARDRFENSLPKAGDAAAHERAMERYDADTQDMTTQEEKLEYLNDTFGGARGSELLEAAENRPETITIAEYTEARESANQSIREGDIPSDADLETIRTRDEEMVATLGRDFAYADDKDAVLDALKGAIAEETGGSVRSDSRVQFHQWRRPFRLLPWFQFFE